MNVEIAKACKHDIPISLGDMRWTMAICHSLQSRFKNNSSGPRCNRAFCFAKDVATASYSFVFLVAHMTTRMYFDAAIVNLLNGGYMFWKLYCRGLLSCDLTRIDVDVDYPSERYGEIRFIVRLRCKCLVVFHNGIHINRP